MKLSLITEALAQIEIKYVTDEDYTPETWDQAYNIAEQSGIRISSNKELRIIAVDEDWNVHGAVWSDYSIHDELTQEYNYGKDEIEEIYAYDFDVVVKKESRAIGMTSPRVGISLIDAALRDYKYTSEESGYKDCVMVMVVNPKLAKWLEEKRGFEPYSMSKGIGRMIYYNR